MLLSARLLLEQYRNTGSAPYSSATPHAIDCVSPAAAILRMAGSRCTPAPPDLLWASQSSNGASSRHGPLRPLAIIIEYSPSDSSINRMW